MIADSGPGWATTLADLAIILFLITAADLANVELAQDALEGTPAAITTAEPVAIYRPQRGMPSLNAWLETQPDDPRQRLTIVVHHDGRDAQAAMAQGARLTNEAERAGRDARMIVERSERPEVAAILAYDADPQAMARKLLSLGEESNPTEDIR